MAHRQLIHILQHCRHKCQKAQVSGFCRWSQVYIPHTHLAHFPPNQHTPTCRSINGLVSKQPAYPQMGDILGSQPFLSPIERAYLELHHTAGCEAEPLFHNSFIARDHLLGPQHTRTTGRCTGVNVSFCTKSRCVLKLQSLAALHTVLQLSPFSFPSCSRKGALFAQVLTVFARGVTKRVH